MVQSRIYITLVASTNQTNRFTFYFVLFVINSNDDISIYRFNRDFIVLCVSLSLYLSLCLSIYAVIDCETTFYLAHYRADLVATVCWCVFLYLYASVCWCCCCGNASFTFSIYSTLLYSRHIERIIVNDSIDICSVESTLFQQIPPFE